LPSLDIIIVNWNSGMQLQRCLTSMLLASREGFELARVVVVDNASSDGSAERLDFLGLPVLAIRNSLNRGFAAACNQGVQGSEADYLLFLNPDTILLEDSVEAPIGFLERSENTRIGICGVQLADLDGRVSRTCARFPTPGHLVARCVGLDRVIPRVFPNHFLSEWEHHQSRAVDQVMGAFFLVRRALFDRLLGFDERFFVYYEDLDFAFRARQLGWSSYFLSRARALHWGGGCSENAKALRLFYSLRSRILYAYKHFPSANATGVLLATLLLEPFARLGRAVIRGSVAEIVETGQGYWSFWKATPRLLVKGREA
jgi:GT2 family glycosyltransferase